MQRFKQRHVVELGIVRERDDARAGVGPERRHRVIGHVGNHGRAGDGIHLQIVHARIAHGNRKAVEHGHGGQILGQRAGADQQHAVARAQRIRQLPAVKVQRGGHMRFSERDPSRSKAHLTPHQPARRQLGQ
ncbi:hypothetical protein D3C71_1530640 [compost metagenome]